MTEAGSAPTSLTQDAGRPVCVWQLNIGISLSSGAWDLMLRAGRPLQIRKGTPDTCVPGTGE
jgi:hypothetical protein